MKFEVNLRLFRKRLPNLKCFYAQLLENTVEDWGIGNSVVISSIKAHEHSLLAGMPARVIKTDVFWDRKRI